MLLALAVFIHTAKFLIAVVELSASTTLNSDIPLLPVMKHICPAVTASPAKVVNTSPLPYPSPLFLPLSDVLKKSAGYIPTTELLNRVSAV